MAKWLITGGLGFIGSNLRQKIMKDFPDSEIFILDNFQAANVSIYEMYRDELGINQKVQQEWAEISIMNFIIQAKKFEPDYIIHLAAETDVRESLKNPHRSLSRNIQGTLNVFAAAKSIESVKKIVFASSCGVGVGNIANKPLDLDCMSLSPYIVGKGMGEAIALSYGELRTPVSILRFSNVYGPFSYHKGSFIPKAFRALNDDKEIEIFGSGYQTRDFIYVEDVCDAIIKAALIFYAPNILSIGSGVSTSVFNTVEMVGTKYKFVDEVKGEIQNVKIDNALAKKSLGWEPKTALKEGLVRTKKWFQKIA